MKCIRCGHDSKYKERTDRTCPGCHQKFAFEPRAGDPITDRGFQNAIDAVSAKGEVRWGVEHLYYDVCRHKRVSKSRMLATTIGLFVVAAVCAGVALAGVRACWLGSLAGTIAGTVGLLVLLLADYDHARLDASDFRRLYERWCEVHGTPKSVIVRQPPGPPPKLEPDVADYSFDRAVICDRARTVDLLLANNFHFENNCAVLSVEGYPPGVFETVRTMLKRNPQLRVYALHDASVAGCRLAHTLATDPAWFAGKVRIIDVGLRPAHAARFCGLLQHSRDAAVAAADGITAAEAVWLSSHVLELAAVRPEQVLKRLFRAMNATTPPAKTASQTDGGSDAVILVDGDSFASDAAVIDASVDAFG